LGTVTLRSDQHVSGFCMSQMRCTSCRQYHFGNCLHT